MCKENKNNDFIQQFISSASPYSAILGSITYVNNICNVYNADTLFTFKSKRKQRISVQCCWHRTAYPYIVYVCDTLQNGAIGRRGGDELLNKSLFCFLCTQNSRSFVKLQLNHWCDMDYFNDVLIILTFLSLDHARILAVFGRVRKLSYFIKNILIYVQKKNEGLTGLEQHEGE